MLINTMTKGLSRNNRTNYSPNPISRSWVPIRVAVQDMLCDRGGYYELKEWPVIVERSFRGTYEGHRSRGKTDQPGSRESLVSWACPPTGNALHFASDRCSARAPQVVRSCESLQRPKERRCQDRGFVNGHFSKIGRVNGERVDDSSKGFQNLVRVDKQDRHVLVTSSFRASYPCYLLFRRFRSCVNELPWKVLLIIKGQ